MSTMTLSKNGQKFTRVEWLALSNEERESLLRQYGPAYTEESTIFKTPAGSKINRKIR